MLLEQLTQTFGVSGYETQVAELVIKEVLPFADAVTKDAVGNIIALKKGTGGNKKIMCSAHMDEIGFSVISVDEKGLLKLKKMGGISAHNSFMNRIVFENGVKGTIGSYLKPNDLKEADVTKLYADIGAKDKEDALKMVSIGDVASYSGKYEKLANNRVMSKALDDRIGCYIQIEALKRLEKPYHDIYFVFSVQEEVGLIGATTAAERIKPDLGIAIDITGSFDIPNDTDGYAVIGGGAAIKINDSSVICDKALVNKMINCAEKNKIKYQRDALNAGGTDAGAINKSYMGVKALGISIPTRYGHSPNSIVSLSDTEDCIALLKEFLQEEISFETEITYK